jgi:MOSC domain-containing protein YiiM
MVAPMIRIGPYRFTRQDTDRTLRHYDELWELYRDGRDATSIDHLKTELTGDAEVDLPCAWASFLVAGPALRSAGQLPARTKGRVVQVNVSGGGVPKLPVDVLEVGFSGAEGDVQRSKKHHGAPWQALCIWSTEAIAELNAAGHALGPGAAGENVTVEGLPWDEVRAGVRLQLGTLLCEVSFFALPCSQNKRWFAGGDFRAMHHERGPSRVYATVLEPGRITTGDPAILEP